MGLRTLMCQIFFAFSSEVSSDLLVKTPTKAANYLENLLHSVLSLLISFRINPFIKIILNALPVKIPVSQIRYFYASPQ
jgi:hypothetical protein